MATQICPNCKEDAFTWVIVEDNPLTRWGCYKCYYTAWEDESKERVCFNCNKKGELFLKDDEKAFWWCHYCDRVTLV
jgi:hypothetical protein